MRMYTMVLLDPEGKKHTITLEAENEDVLVKEARERGLYPLAVKPAKGGVQETGWGDLPTKSRLAKMKEQGEALRRIHALLERFEQGDDTTYAELMEILRQSTVEDGSAPDLLHQSMLDFLTKLEGFGSPGEARRAFREERAQRKALVARALQGDRTAISQLKPVMMFRGRLRGDESRASGEVQVLDSNVVFIVDDRGKLKVNVLCPMTDVVGFRLRGLFRKSIEMKDRVGNTWTFDADINLRDPDVQKRMKVWKRMAEMHVKSADRLGL